MKKIKLKANLTNGKSVEVEFNEGDPIGHQAAMEIIRSVVGVSTPKIKATKKVPVAVKSAPKKAVKNGAKAVIISGKKFASISEASKSLHVGEKRIRNAIKTGKKLDGKSVKLA